MTPLARSAAATAMVLMLLAGCSAIAYARWMRPLADGDAALAAGRYEPALASYADAEARFDRFAAAKELFAGDYGHVMANQLWVLHRLQRYDETIDQAQRAPESALPHFWSGCAFFEKARLEQRPDPRLGWLTRAEEESPMVHEAETRASSDGSRSAHAKERVRSGAVSRRGNLGFPCGGNQCSACVR